MPSAKGENWEKFNKEFADEEAEQKKIQPLSDEYVPLQRCCKRETPWLTDCSLGISRC